MRKREQRALIERAMRAGKIETQVELAGRIGVTPRAVAHWMRGDRELRGAARTVIETLAASKEVVGPEA